MFPFGTPPPPPKNKTNLSSGGIERFIDLQRVKREKIMFCTVQPVRFEYAGTDGNASFECKLKYWNFEKVFNLFQATGLFQ